MKLYVVWEKREIMKQKSRKNAEKVPFFLRFVKISFTLHGFCDFITIFLII